MGDAVLHRTALLIMSGPRHNEKFLLSGDEAVARGAWEAGLKVAAAYPGTPSTEILENLAKFKELSKKSNHFFFGTFFTLVAGSIIILFSFIRIILVGKMDEQATQLHYGIVVPLLVVCIILYFIFNNKYKEASDNLAKFFKEKVLKK